MISRRFHRVILILGAVLTTATLLTTQASAVAAVKVKSDISYGPAKQPGANLLDVYTPSEKTTESRPVVVWIHGGGWFKGDKANTTMPGKAKAFVDAGFILVSVNYRLSPNLKGPRYLAKDRVRFPAAHLDVARAVGWVDKHIGRFGGDPGRILIGGESAGAQIATLLSTRPGFLLVRGVAASQIKGAISLDAVGFDVGRMMTAKYRKLNAGFQRMMFNAFGTPAEEKRKSRWAAASPITYADPTDPPIYFVESATAIDRRVDAFHMSVALEQLPLAVSRVVPLDHQDGVGGLLGRSGNDRGVTKRVLRFASEAANPVSRQILVKGKRVVRAAGKSTATVRLTVAAKPGAAQIFCRMDNHFRALCPRSWDLEPGVHSLGVEAYGHTGRLVAEKTVSIRVKK